MTENQYPGLLLCSSGIDFCGKSTQALRMYNWLRAYIGDKKRETILTKQPTTERFGRKIRTKIKKMKRWSGAPKFFAGSRPRPFWLVRLVEDAV